MEDPALTTVERRERYLASAAGERPRRWPIVVAWIAAIVPMLAFLGNPPVQRTQEARVLVTAREMLDLGGGRWLIPRMNGRLRLEKPPLTYWLTAGAFAVGGVNEWAGRVPAAMCGWLAVAAVYLVGAHWFDRRTGFFAAAALMGGIMFYRLSRLAETDVWVMLFDTCAIAAIWRGAELLGDASPPPASRAAGRWFLASGAFIGLAALAKGVPALFVLLFLAMGAIQWRRRRVLWRWVVSGAPVAALFIGLAWYAYVAHAIGINTFRAELNELRGEDHSASAFEYLPQLLYGLLPWTGFTVAAIVAAAINFRRDPRARALLTWCAAIAIPLLLTPQKQYHYLMPLYPPLAILTGWFVAEGTRRAADARAARTVAIVLGFTLATALLVALALPLLARRYARGDILSVDLLLAGAIAVGCALIWQAWRRRGARIAMAGFAVFAAALMPLALGRWAPTLFPMNSRAVARRLVDEQPGTQPFCFWGENVSIPLVFELRTIVPEVDTPQELAALSQKEPDLLVLSLARPRRPAPPLPHGWEQIDQVTTDERTIEVYRATR